MNMKLSACCLALATVFTGVSSAADTTISGFMSVGGGKVDDAYPLLPACVYPQTIGCAQTGAVTSNAGYTEDKFTFDNDSVFGLQVSSQVNDRVSVTGQFLSKGSEKFDVAAEWAYVSYQASDNLKLRAGRFVIPFYLYSDFRNVGYALPWIRAPQSVYSLEFNSTNGIDFVWTPSLGFFDVTLQGYTGSNKFRSPALANAETKTQNGMGLSLTLNHSWLTLRVASHQADVSINGDEVRVSPTLTLNQFAAQVEAANPAFSQNADLLRVEGDKFTFDEAAISVDTGRFLAVVESTKLRSDTFYKGTDRSMAMLGFRTGNLLFHVTAGKADDPVQDMTENIPVVPQTLALRLGLDGVAANIQRIYKTRALGVRWDFTSSAAFKLEVEELDDDKSDKTKLVSFAVQSVF